MISLAPNITELHAICDLPTEPALQQAAAFLTGLARDPAFVEAEILPLLQEAQGARDWYVTRRLDAEDGSYSLQIFAWPPGTGTRIHDHSSWGAYACAAGSIIERRYVRLDDGSRPDHARLKESWQLSWSPEDGASTVQPGDGGIHSVGNPGGESVAVSVHLYG
ncbi:MAG: cysteine dioxygenase, partial [Rubrobacter sp.]